MTREQAIKELTELLPEEFLSEYAEAIRMAIKALEQEPTDAVSRQRVAEVLLKYAHSTEGKAFAEFLVSQINDLPSVTPQPKMGRWLVLKDEYDDICEAVCSCCDKNGNHKWAFCPNCGAKMQEVEE